MEKQRACIELPKRHIPYQLDRGDGVRRVLRQEHKFSINEMQFWQYSAKMSQVLKKDANSGADGYMVRSLYFDTLGDSDYYTKIDGVDSRRKVRLRIYRPDSDFALLEMKQKQSVVQQKRSVKISRVDAMHLCNGDYTPLLKYDNPFALECYTLMESRGYLPKAIVQYQRNAFTANGNEIRITFDRRIVATESNFDIFSDKLCMYPVQDPFITVLEVKYNNFLYSYIKELMQRLEKSAIAASKYCMARSISLGMDF